MKPDVDDELRAAYRQALSGKSVTLSADAMVRIYRMSYFHVPLPRFVTRIRERLT